MGLESLNFNLVVAEGKDSNVHGTWNIATYIYHWKILGLEDEGKSRYPNPWEKQMERSIWQGSGIYLFIGLTRWNVEPNFYSHLTLTNESLKAA